MWICWWYKHSGKYGFSCLFQSGLAERFSYLPGLNHNKKASIRTLNILQGLHYVYGFLQLPNVKRKVIWLMKFNSHFSNVQWKYWLIKTWNAQELAKLALTGEVSHDRRISAGWTDLLGMCSVWINVCAALTNRKESQQKARVLMRKKFSKPGTLSSHMWIVATKFCFIILQYAEHMFLQLGWFSAWTSQILYRWPCQQWARVDYAILTDLTTTAPNPSTTFITWRSWEGRGGEVIRMPHSS